MTKTHMPEEQQDSGDGEIAQQTVRTEPDLETVQRQCDEYLAGWKRAQADYANLMRETERSKQEFAKFATEQSLLKLLPAIDQFEVAMQFTPSLDGVPDNGRRTFETWITGLEAIRSLWTASAKELGLERISATGLLDPSIHEAVAEESHESVPAGHIVRATQNGWTLNGKLIRPAKVLVSKGPLA
ncbi:MAG TPA: nucleotide exchange factor GrpE [Candidatus Methylomirabilis sp.]|nr:nucleotide exchange factor GrpE [Candidatus Methylomirabilis sp.]